MLILGSDFSDLRLFHLHRNWTSKIRWNRDWRKTRTNAKWSIANVNRFVHPRVYRSPIFLLHGFTKSKNEDEVLNHENKTQIQIRTIKSWNHVFNFHFVFNPFLCLNIFIINHDVKAFPFLLYV